MIERGSGSILFTGGGFGLQPHPDYLSLSIGKAGIRALAQGIFEPFQEKGVHVATVTVAGLVLNKQRRQYRRRTILATAQPACWSWQVETVYKPAG